MELAITKLSEMLSEAFDCGYVGTADERDVIITDILEKHKISEADDVPLPPEEDTESRLYDVAELRNFPVGTIFNHSTLGKCRIQKRHGEKYMAFDNPGLAPAGLNVDGYPWDMPMKRAE